MKREIGECRCKTYNEKPLIAKLFGHKYCEYCQTPDETDWWDGITPHQRAAYLVWFDLRGRSGFDMDIPPEIVREILTTWASIIKKCQREVK